MVCLLGNARALVKRIKFEKFYWKNNLPKFSKLLKFSRKLSLETVVATNFGCKPDRAFDQYHTGWKFYEMKFRITPGSWGAPQCNSDFMDKREDCNLILPSSLPLTNYWHSRTGQALLLLLSRSWWSKCYVIKF